MTKGMHECCLSVMKKNPRIHLEKSQKIIKKTDIQNVKKVETKFETYATGTCTLKLR